MNPSPDHIAKLQQEYAEKYVVADASRPELARFEGLVGQVKTVNFNGRALVEFDGHGSRGRYDIQLDYLKVVEKPEPKPPPAKRKAAAAAGKKASAETAGTKSDSAEKKPPEKLSSLEIARLEKDANKPPANGTEEGPDCESSEGTAKPSGE